jgi:hypothetical protein
MFCFLCACLAAGTALPVNPAARPAVAAYRSAPPSLVEAGISPSLSFSYDACDDFWLLTEAL